MVSGKDYVDVKIDGVRSELRADIAEMRADLRAMGAKIEALPSTWTLLGTVAGGFAVSLSLLFTFLSYSGDHAESARVQQMQLDKVAALSERNAGQIAGVSSGLDRVAALSEQNARLIEQNSRQITDMSGRLDRVIGALEQQSGGRR